MASQTRTEVVVCGAAQLVVAPKESIAPVRWSGPPARLARMDRLCALALVACDGALVDGQLSSADPAWNPERTAVTLGTAYGCHATNEDYYRGVVAGGAASPRLFAYTLPSSPVGEISIHYAIRGPAGALVSGLPAGVGALISGVRELTTGRADRALVCAAEVATPLLERLIGTRVSDAAAALLLERADSATARGARIKARVLATASAYAAGDRAAAVADATRRALKQAEVRPGAVERLIAGGVDVPAVRSLGVEAVAVDDAPEALAAAPLVTLARRLDSGGLTLVLAADPEGGAAAALLGPFCSS